VRNDSRIALRLLREGRGIILWHDYESWYDVTRALNELYRTPEGADLRRIQGTSLVYVRRG
jgi:hypothetical protein